MPGLLLSTGPSSFLDVIRRPPAHTRTDHNLRRGPGTFRSAQCEGRPCGYNLWVAGPPSARPCSRTDSTHTETALDADQDPGTQQGLVGHGGGFPDDRCANGVLDGTELWVPEGPHCTPVSTGTACGMPTLTHTLTANTVRKSTRPEKSWQSAPAPRANSSHKHRARARSCWPVEPSARDLRSQGPIQRACASTLHLTWHADPFPALPFPVPNSA